VIQVFKSGLRIMRYELTDYEWAAIKPMLPNKPRGVPGVNDRVSSTAFSGSFDLEHPGEIYRKCSATTPLAATGSFTAGVPVLEPYHRCTCRRP
jgi:transposase